MLFPAFVWLSSVVRSLQLSAVTFLLYKHDFPWCKRILDMHASHSTWPAPSLSVTFLEQEFVIYTAVPFLSMDPSKFYQEDT